jgi:4-methyl-5(b-hydroxyethyl)-thiazole monophosphate biosynthesis
MSKVRRALVAIANGSEDMETVILVDVLRRAQIDVLVASIEESLTIKLSRGVVVEADVSISDASLQEFDVICLPGGMPGSTRLAESTSLVHLLKHQKATSKYVAAICAAPSVVLDKHGFFSGSTRATCHSAFTFSHCPRMSDSVVVDADHKLITSKGPGTALQWALVCVSALVGKEKAVNVASSMEIHAAVMSEIDHVMLQ